VSGADSESFASFVSGVGTLAETTREQDVIVLKTPRSIPGRDALLAVVLMLLAPLAAAIATAGPAQAGPGFQQPRVGECRDLTFSQMMAASDRTKSTNCANPHTTLTFAVPRLPQGMSWSAPAEKIGLAAFNKCQPKWEDVLGRTEKAREMSAYSWAWFVPTKAQRDHGARWFRCDLILYGGGSRLLRLQDDQAPVLAKPPLPNSVARCLTPKLKMTACSRGHVWRATGAFRMRGATYPSAKRFQANADRCRSRVHSRRFVWDPPSRPAWRLGTKTVVCYTRTRH
jgi:Septum formation